MSPFHMPGRSRGEGKLIQSFAELLRRLDEGWQIEPPVYIMHDPWHRDRLVVRMVLWHDGNPQVASVPDGPDIRQFMASRQIRQERL